MFHFFGKKTQCNHKFNPIKVSNIVISIQDQQYSNKPNVEVIYKCEKCSAEKVELLHMPGALEKKFTLEDFQ